MNNRLCIEGKATFSMLFVIISFFAFSCAAAFGAADPTRPADAMADVLKQRLTGAETMRLHALVTGVDGEGVALVGRDAKSAVAVRRGSTLTETVEGVKVEIVIRSVTALGVELETSDEKKSLFLPGSYRALSAPTNPPPEFLSYLEADQVPLNKLARLISDQTGVNISSSDATSERNVSIFLRNITADAAVEEICRTCSLWFRCDPSGGVIRITTMDEYADNLNTFREESTETFTLLYPNVLEVASVIYGLYPDRTLLSLGEEEFDEDAEYDLSRRFRRFRLLEDNGNSQFMEMQTTRSSSSGSRSGSGTFSFSRGNALSRLNQWDQLNDRARGRRTAFGSREALSADEAKFIDLATVSGNTNLVDFAMGRASLATANIFVTLSRKNNKLIVRTSDVKVMDEIRKLVKEMDVPTPMVLMEVKVLELQLDDDYNAGFKWTLLDYNEGSQNGVATHTLGKAGDAGVVNLAARTLTAGQTAIDPTFTFMAMTDYVKAEIEMMQKDGKIKTLSTPTLLTANNEVSRIFSGMEYPLVTGWTQGETTSTEAGIIQSSPTVEIERKDVGTMLLISPNINSDKTVTIHMLQENSEVAGTVMIPVDGGDGSEKPIDYVQSRSLTGTFIAKDGMTMMAGGLIKESVEETYYRTPFLGSIPLLGWFFRGTDKVKTRKELIVLITPHVITTPMEGGRISSELMKKLSDHPAADGTGNMGVFRRGENPAAKEHTVLDDLGNIVK